MFIVTISNDDDDTITNTPPKGGMVMSTGREILPSRPR